MRHFHLLIGTATLGLAFATTGCNAAPAPEAPTAAAVTAPTAAGATDAPARVDATLASILVHKTPTCGCCGAWVEHLREAGFAVEVQDHDDLGPTKERLGVPYGKGSCHTAEVTGYIVEGHVPAADIKRLLAEKPDARGLVLPGMPIGSPGMESPDGTVQPYTVELVQRDGSTRAWASHGN